MAKRTIKGEKNLSNGYAILVRLTPTEYSALDKLSKERGITRAEILRSGLHRAAKIGAEDRTPARGRVLESE